MKTSSLLCHSERRKSFACERFSQSRNLLAPPALRCTLVAALLSAPAVAQEFPQGWRRPSPAETSDNWRQRNRNGFLTIEADFDGDAKPDIAELLVKPSTNRFGVFMRLAATGVWQELVKGDRRSLPNIGIASARRGTYKTACGKSYGDYACANGEPNSLEIKAAAIDVIYEESSDTVYYWDRNTKAFRGLLMSD